MDYDGYLADKQCYLCKKHNALTAMVVCAPCFKKVMMKRVPVPVLFAKWSKQDDGE